MTDKLPIDNPVQWKRPLRTEQENRERAFAAAARRNDRPLEARIASALEASRYHYERTGRCFYITPAIVDSKQTFEELEEESHFRDPDLLLPSTVTREQIYQQHLDSLAPVRQYSIPTGVISDFMNGIINGHLNNDPTGLVNAHLPVNQTGYANIQQDMTINFSAQSTSFSSQQTLTSLDGADDTSKSDFAGHDFHSLPFETVTEAVSQTYVNGMHMETFQITSAFSVEDIKLTSDSNGPNLKDGNVDFSEWLHDDPTIGEEGSGRQSMEEKKGDTDESNNDGEETTEGEEEGKKEI